MTETIGFVGVGRMGSRMAKNLLDAGYDVVVYDVDRDRVEEMVDAGARGEESIPKLAVEATLVMTSLPTSEIVEEVYLADDGLLAHLDEGSVAIEMSTVSPSVMEGIYAAAEGIGVVDSPVIGPPPEATAATLTIVVACDDTAFNRVSPVLDHLCNRLERVDGIGTAKRIKLANNVMTYGNFAIAAEMHALVEEMGIEPEEFFEIINSGAAGSAIVNAKMPKALSGDDEPGFTVDGARGDLQYALGMKEEADFATPIAAEIAEQYTFTASRGAGDRDYSVMLEILSGGDEE